MNDDFDVGKLVSKFIDILIRQYQFLLLLCLGFTFLVFAYQYIGRVTRNQLYESNVLVVTTKAKSEISLGSGFKTTTDDQSRDILSRNQRLQSFVLLVDNPAVANAVMLDLGPELASREIGIEQLGSMVTGELVPNSDSIRITVVYTDPMLTSQIANVWGREYVDHINAVYSRSTGGLSLSAFQEKTQQAKTDYQQAQDNLDAFLQNNKISEYTRQISATNTIIKNLSSAQNDLISSMIDHQAENTGKIITEIYQNQAQAQSLNLRNNVTNQIDVYKKYVDLDRDSRAAAVDMKRQEVVLRLSNLITESVQAASYIDNVNTMLSQVKNGGQAAVASNNLALMLLKTQIFANFKGSDTLRLTNLPAAFGANIEATTVSGMVDDLQSLLNVLKERQKELGKQIEASYTEILNADFAANLDHPLKPGGALAALNEQRYQELSKASTATGFSRQADITSTQLIQDANQQANAFLNLSGLQGAMLMRSDSSPLGQEIKKLESQEREYTALLSNERSKLAELMKAKDLAWDAYQALAAKEAELQLSADASGTEVALGASASEMGMPSLSSKSRLNSSNMLPLAFIFSLILGILIAIVYEMWCSYHDLTPQPIVDVRRDIERMRRSVRREVSSRPGA